MQLYIEKPQLEIINFHKDMLFIPNQIKGSWVTS